MQPPQPVWEVEYKHDRRAHRHRCWHCRRIINAGEQVVMARILGKRTKALHAECGTQTHGSADSRWTARDAMVAWGTEYIRALGFKVPPHPMSLVGN